MGLNLDAAAKDLDKLFPFQLFREFTKALPSSSQGFYAVSILSFLDLSRLIVPIDPSERGRECREKRQTLLGRPKQYPSAFRSIPWLGMIVSGDMELRSLVYSPGFSPEDEVDQSKVRYMVDYTHHMHA